MVRRILLVLLLIGVGAGLWFAYAPRRTPAGQTALAEVTEVEAFRRWFNDGMASTRVVVLLSPT
jgi:hypothetical protein